MCPVRPQAPPPPREDSSHHKQGNTRRHCAGVVAAPPVQKQGPVWCVCRQRCRIISSISQQQLHPPDPDGWPDARRAHAPQPQTHSARTGPRCAARRCRKHKGKKRPGGCARRAQRQAANHLDKLLGEGNSFRLRLSRHGLAPRPPDPVHTQSARTVFHGKRQQGARARKKAPASFIPIHPPISVSSNHHAPPTAQASVQSAWPWKLLLRRPPPPLLPSNHPCPPPPRAAKMLPVARPTPLRLPPKATAVP